MNTKDLIKHKEIIVEITVFMLGLLASIFGVIGGSIYSILGGVFAVAASLLALLYSVREKALSNAKERKFEVLEHFDLGSPPSDDLTDLEWDGKNLLFVGRINGVNGLFRLDNEFNAVPFIQPDEGWFWKIAFNKNYFVVRISEGTKFGILEYTENGKLLNSIKLRIEEFEHPGFLIFDGKYYWIGFDVVNRVYKLSERFEVIDQFTTLHRLLCAAYADGSLWVSDASTIYQYDLLFNNIDRFNYPGTSCSGLTFDNKTMWSLDKTTKSLRKHSWK
ncbi:MAG: hypothetical protein H6669_07225 [Ardenticatenaceae bacterium]|nr:hypothetical protein [Ardenticatenaceae bacterium]